MAKRLLALLGAVAMVAGAFAYRSRGDAPAAGGGGEVAEGAVICAQELGPLVCDALPGAVVEPAAVTADRLIRAQNVAAADVSAWVTAGPWAEMVDEARAGRPPLFETAPPLATTRLVAVVKRDRLPAACGGRATWKCLGAAATGDPAFLLAADPATGGAGVFLRAALLTGFFDGADYATNDLDLALDLMGTLDERQRAARARNATDLQRFLIQAPDVPVYLTTEAAVGGVAANAAVLAPEPVATVGAYLSVRPGSRDRGRDRVAAALVEARWKASPLPADDGLPSPGVLVALRGRTE